MNDGPLIMTIFIWLLVWLFLISRHYAKLHYDGKLNACQAGKKENRAILALAIITLILALILKGI